MGRGGWTWYTGSAGWMYRIWIEEVLGFRLRGDMLTLRPVLPEAWPGFDLTYRYRSTVYHIHVHKDPAVLAPVIEIDDHQAATHDVLQLIDDGGSHHVTVQIPHKVPSLPASDLLQVT